MKFYISYFYQIRNFNKSMIPLSTALYDPKWFHDNKGKDYVFKDRNGVYNGFRAEILTPSKCTGCPCPKDVQKNPETCAFITQYRDYLSHLNFGSFIKYCKALADQIKEIESIHDPSIVLLVYETPDNKCSERSAIIEWFNKNGCQIVEFIP